MKNEFSGMKLPEESACQNAWVSYGKFLILNGETVRRGNKRKVGR